MAMKVNPSQRCACVCACVRACVHARARVRVRVCNRDALRVCSCVCSCVVRPDVLAVLESVGDRIQILFDSGDEPAPHKLVAEEAEERVDLSDSAANAGPSEQRILRNLRRSRVRSMVSHIFMRVSHEAAGQQAALYTLALA